jgi:dihydrofolate reductase
VVLPPVSVAFVVACAANGIIGKDGQLPWRLPADLQHFKRLTLGKPVVMGRKTYESIGRPLPRRTNIVVTTDAAWRAEGVQVAHELPTALAIAYEDAHRVGADEVMVIGGGAIYRQCADIVRRIYLTEVHRDYDGDARFDVPRVGWTEVSRIDHPQGPDGAPAFSFVTLERNA